MWARLRLKRRGFLKNSIAVGLAIGVVGCGSESLPPERVVTHNAILIVIDTLRADRLGFMGAGRPTSPRVDWLAQHGVAFSEAFASSPWTVPSTASIVTSLYPTQHGAGVVGTVRDLRNDVPAQIIDAVPTVATILDSAGFRCGLFSANPYLYGRFKDGFDPAIVERMPATRLMDSALEFIGSAGTSRFFAHIQLMDLHQPIEPPGSYFDFFPTPEAGPRDARHKEWGFSGGEFLDTRQFQDFRTNRLALYDGALRYIDSEIGRLVDALADLEILDDTLIIVTSDHGEEFWDHAAREASLGGDPRGFYGIGHGHSMFQELLRVPLVFFGPGVQAGIVEGAPISLLDIAPTLLGFLGVDKPDVMRGVDRRKLVVGQSREISETTDIFAESPAYGPDSWAVISDGWKLIERVDGVVLLFDLNNDPLESVDLSLKNPHQVRELRKRAMSLRGTLVAIQTTDSRALDDATKEQLRVLGYLE